MGMALHKATDYHIRYVLCFMFYSHLVRQICPHMHVHVDVWLMAHPVGMNMCAHEYLMLEECRGGPGGALGKVRIRCIGLNSRFIPWGSPSVWIFLFA